MAVWVVKGGSHGEFEDAFLSQRVIGKGGRLPNLSSVASRDELRKIFERSHPDAQPSQVANHVGQFWSLLKNMEEGELVVVPLKTTHNVAVGRIGGPYEYREDLPDTLHHVRPVDWINTDVARDAFDQDLLYSFGAFITIGRVNRDQAEQRILAALGQRQGPAPAPPVQQEETRGGAEEALDLEVAARDQIRLFLGAKFVGHDLTRLVGAILQAQGFVVTLSPPGADQGIDILGGHGALGLGSPRVVVQVKSGQAGIDELRSLRGLVTALGADQGLLVAWRGFRGTARAEAKQDYFKMRLWDSEDLLSALFAVYDRLGEDIRSEIPLQRVWSLVPALE